jgi:predicted nucleic acid-binding protein
MKKLLSKNISIDTSFFESQNFLAGSKLMELSNLYKDNLISLYITDIVYKEVLSRFSKNIKEAEEKIKKPKKLLEVSASILRNFSDFDFYFKFPEIEITKLQNQFKLKFDSWINDNNVDVISTGHLTIKDVFDDYFENKAPFKEGEKKHEFPDAFTLKALIEKFKNSKSYLLTGDNDLLNFQSDVLLPTNDVSDLIDLIIRTHKEKVKQDAISLIEMVFHKDKNTFETVIRKEISNSINDEVNLTISIDNFEIDSLNQLNISDIDFESFSIIHLGENNAKI